MRRADDAGDACVCISPMCMHSLCALQVLRRDDAGDGGPALALLAEQSLDPTRVVAWTRGRCWEEGVQGTGYRLDEHREHRRTAPQGGEAESSSSAVAQGQAKRGR